MKKIIYLFIVLNILGVFAALQATAAEKMDSHIAGMTVEQRADMFLMKKDIDAYTVSFHVMRSTPGMEHGGSHNFMVKIEKGNTPQVVAKINSKIILADGSAVSKHLMKMGDWYMNGYDLGSTGRYQLMILFKTLDGKKHKGGVYFEQK